MITAATTITDPSGAATPSGTRTIQAGAKVSLCVEVTRSHTAGKRGTPVQWVVDAWTEGGNVPNATVQLQTIPASVTPQFSFGCGSSDGTRSCNLGAMDAASARRQLQAQVTVPVTASTVKSVRLTVIGSAAHLPKAPEASATVAITAPAAPTSSPTPTNSSTPTNSPTPTGTPTPTATAPGTALPTTTTTPLPVGSLPYIPAATPALRPGGNAAPLFPVLTPSPSATHAGHTAHTDHTDHKAKTRPVADTSALPEGAPVADAQLIGLAALALAFILAITRLSIRRHPAPVPDTPTTPTTPIEPVRPEAPVEEPSSPEPPGTAPSGETADHDKNDQNGPAT